jgi:hypothetical protein
MKGKNTMDSVFREMKPVSKRQPTYWLTRFVILRLLGAVYAVAFLVAINQVIPLIGSDGLLPVDIYLRQWSDAVGPVGGFIKASFHLLVRALGCCAFDRFVDRVYTFLHCSGGLCKCAITRRSLVFVYVYCTCGPGLVWVWLGDPVA